MSGRSGYKRQVLFGIVFACVLATTGLAADERVSITPSAPPPKKTGSAPAIRVNVKLTLIPVTVTDPFGAPFSGLTHEAFQLFEDGVEQELKYFNSEDAPVSMGVVFDASRSMTGAMDKSRIAISQFFHTATPGDEFFLVAFGDAPRILSGFTTDTTAIEKELVGIKPKGWTALYDAVYLAIQQMRHAKNARKALLVLSDGGDNNSRYTESEMQALVREADVCIYSIGLASGDMIKRHVRLLRRLSEQTGGHFYQVNKTNELPEAVSKISAAIRDQYVLGYFSSNAENDGLYRKIEVKLNPRPGLPRLRASWRSGYYAPPAW